MLIRPWRAGDHHLVAAAEHRLSEQSLNRRFLVGTGGRLPAAYLRHVAQGPRPPAWDAQVAVDGGVVCGWAEYGLTPGTADGADLAVIVADAWQREGVASALVRALVHRMVGAGIRHLHAEVLPSNRAVQGFVRALAGADPEGGFVDGLVRYDFPLVDVPAELAAPNVAGAARDGQNAGTATAV